MTGEEVDITEFPQNIHEYHRMIATAQANAMKLEELSKMTKTDNEANADQKSDQESGTSNSKMTKREAEK